MKNIVLFTLAFCAFRVSAQTPGVQDHINKMITKPVPTSPNVSSLGRYGDYKVSLFTGLPEISIPIFEVKSGDLNVPITLNYHASGIKPTDIASWVGAGWSISAGGQVSRAVSGKPDEEYFYSHALESEPSSCNTFYYLDQSANHVIDTEPDVFSYSYPGRTGRFLLPNGAPPYLVPYAPVIVDPNYTPHNFPMFEITDEGGVLYQYGVGTKGTSKEFTNATNGGNPTVAATTAWHLMEIVAPNSDDRISFEYQDVGTAYYHDIVQTQTLIDQCAASNGATCPSYTVGSGDSNIDSWVNQWGIKTIYFETGKVDFVLGGLRSDANDLKLLDRIEIFSKVKGGYVKKKTIQFLHDYFYNEPIAGTTEVEALKLTAVEFLDAASAMVQKYKLSYTTNNVSWRKSLDFFYLRRRDLWGYYSGPFNEGLVLKKTVEYVSPGGSSSNIVIGYADNRDVNPIYAKEGVLSRIDFPTGGFTSFEYESNKYLDNGTIKLAGGLRVTKITSNDGVGGSVIKSYRYGENESGYGIANFNLFELNYLSTSNFYSGCGTVDPAVSYRIRTWQSSSALSQDAFDSSPVSYPVVTEYLGDPSNNTSGKTVYEFRHTGDVNQIVPASGKYYKDSHFWKRGHLRHKTVYDNFNHKLSETDIDYSEYQLSSQAVGIGVFQRISGNRGSCSGPTCVNESGEFVNPQSFSYADYSQSSGVLLEGQTTEYLYKTGDLSKYVMTQQINTRDASKLQITKTTRNKSTTDEQVVTENRYPFQFAGTVNSSSTGAARGIYKLNDKNILRIPLETFTYQQNINETNQRIISGQVTTFKENENNTDHVVADQIFLWESLTPLDKSYYTITGINGGNSDVTKHSGYKPRVSMVGYDSHGNITEIRKTGSHSISYKWGYDHVLPVAEIKNASAKNVWCNSFEEAVSNFSPEGKTGDQSITTGVWQPLTGLDAGSYNLTYYKKQGTDWVYNQSIVQVPGSGEYTIDINGQIDEIRFYPVGAQLTTYTYDQLNGLTSMTDANNFVTYYEYDDFGRLKVVRDNDRNIAKTYRYNYKNEN